MSATDSSQGENRHMHRSWKMIGLTAVLALAVTQRSSALNTTTTYNFTGTCQDCAGTGTATLTVLGNYTLGTALSSSNVVSFTYNGTNLTAPFTITPGSPNFFVSGSIANYPGQNNVNIQSNTFGFFSTTNGSWGVGLSDQGTASIWGAAAPPTPAPSTGILLLLGFATLAGFSLWRNRRIA